MKIKLSNEQIDKVVCNELSILIQDIENDADELNGIIFNQDRNKLLKSLKKVKFYYCGDNTPDLTKKKSCKNCTCGNHI